MATPPSTCISSNRRPPLSDGISTGGKAPGMLAEALKHARVMYREAYER